MKKNLKADLKEQIELSYSQLVELVEKIAPPQRNLPVIQWNHQKISIADLIAYQIGWGKCLIRWYESGVKHELPEMPGEGFSKWNYKALAAYFYKKYQYDGSNRQLLIFKKMVSKIIKIVSAEQKKGNLEKLGVWEWCTLPSGKQWPLSKWISVNTASPYKRAILLLKKRARKDELDL